MKKQLMIVMTMMAVMMVSGWAGSVIQNGDVFRVVIGGVPREYTQEFETEFVVDDGSVSIPYIGRIRAAGLSATQLAVLIEKRLKEEKIFTSPSVAVNPLQQQRYVTVGGAVRNPGVRPWLEGMTLKQALAASSGVADFADDKVKIIRDGVAQVVSRKAIAKNPALDPPLRSGDYVEVLGDF